MKDFLAKNPDKWSPHAKLISQGAYGDISNLIKADSVAGKTASVDKLMDAAVTSIGLKFDPHGL